MKVSIKNENDSTWFIVAIEKEFISDKHNVLYTGAGKINAAMGAQWLIDNFDVKKIINVGTAGGNPNKVEKDKVYAIGKVVDRDWDFPGDSTPEVLIDNNKDLETCYTGDTFVTDWNNDYSIVDMESFAIAKVCADPQNNIPFSCYKYISDTGDDADWQENLVKSNEAFNKMF